MLLLGAASDSVRDQVLRHDPSTGVFGAAYRDQLVRFNVQDAFLENNVSDDGLTRAFTHMSIRCNPGAPDPVSEEFMRQFYTQDPDIIDLERQTAKTKAMIRQKYKFIKHAPKKEVTEYQDLQKQLTSAKKSLKTEIDDAQRKDYFFSIHNVMMKHQLDRQHNSALVENDEADIVPLIVHQLYERTQLQQVLCDLSKNPRPSRVPCPEDSCCQPYDSARLSTGASDSQTAFASCIHICSQEATSRLSTAS